MKAISIIRKTVVGLILLTLGAALGAAACFLFIGERIFQEELSVTKAQDCQHTLYSLRAGEVQDEISRQEEALLSVLGLLRRPFFLGGWDEDMKIQNMSKDRLRVFQEAKEYFERFGWGKVRHDSPGVRNMRDYLSKVPYTQERQDWNQWNAKYKGPNPQPAPELSPVEWLGQPQRREDLSNHVVLVVFWGIRCGRCLEELPQVQKLHELYSKPGLKVVAIHSQKEHDKAKSYLAEQKYTFPLGLVSGKDEVFKKYLVRSLPACYLIDSEGYIVSGPRKDVPSRQQVEALLAGHKLTSATEPSPTAPAAP